MYERIPQSIARKVVFIAYLSSDHLTPATGKTIAITISKNVGAFGNPNAGATNATEIANGWYYYSADTTDTGTAGMLLVNGAGTGVDQVSIGYDVVNANTGELAALPNTAVTTNGSLLTSGSGTAQLTVTAGLASANTTQLAGQTVTAAAGVTFPASVASPTNITAGTITTLSSAGIDAILDQTAGVETGVTPRQCFRLMLAGLAGKVSGASGTTVTIRDTNDTKNRIIATVDSSGNRSAVTLDAS